MIKAVIYKDFNNYIVGFDITGHAGFAKHGKDIVCAAVSILATTTVNSLEEQLAFTNHYKVDDKLGYLSCRIPKDCGQEKFLKAQIILRTLEIGLKSIENNYNKYLKVLEEVD